jgi:hypothetical protein
MSEGSVSTSFETKQISAEPDTIAPDGPDVCVLCHCFFAGPDGSLEGGCAS